MAADDSVDQNDLKRVKGIGVKVERRLKAEGITNLRQLARTPVTELAAILDGLPGKYNADRITREDWLSQAAALATAPPANAGEDEPVKRFRHNFTVEVQVAGRDIVSSKIVHVQTRTPATWGRWDQQQIIPFIEEQAGARPSAPAAESGRAAHPATPPAPAPGAGDIDRDDESGLALHTFAMVPATGPEVTASEAVAATLSFGTAALDLPADRAAQVKADVYALGRPPAKSTLAGSIQVDISPGEQVRLQIPCQLPAIGYPVGLFAIVRLFTAGKAGRIPSSGLPNAEVTLLSATAADNRRSTEGGPSTAGGPREVISGR